MNLYLHVARYFIFLFLAFSAFMATAQDKACKPALKTNRHKALILGDASIEGTEYRSGDITYLSDYLTSNRRRIQAKSSNRLISEFYTEGAEISGNVYREYDLSGKIKLTDSLDQKKGKHTKSYLDYFSSSHVVSSTRHYPNGNPESSTYFNLRKGEDSIIKTWYSNRFPKSIRIKNYWHSDSVITRWDSTGILREYTNSAFSLLYFADGVLRQKTTTTEPYKQWSFYENGILERMVQDTVISGGICHMQRSFYPNGILHTVAYYSGGQACLTWSSYTDEGVLKSRTRKGPVQVAGTGLIAPEAVYAPEQVFYFVEQNPEYPGGDHAFRNDIEKRMADLLCQSKTKLSGSYKLRYSINELGEASFLSLEGLNTDQLSSSFAELFRGLSKWKPGKQNGRLMTVYFVVDVSVKENQILQNKKSRHTS